MNWSTYFDRIYCLHYLPDTKKLPRLMAELSRVGILDSGIFEFRYTSPSPYDKIVSEDAGSKIALNPMYVNVMLEARKVLSEAKALGYGRILFIEDDVCFLKDLDELERGIAASPKGYGVVQYDKFVHNDRIEEYQKCLANKMIDDRYFDAKGCFFPSSACVGYFGDGISEMLHLMDKFVIPPDTAPQVVTTGYAVAKKNLAIQVFYSGTNSIDNFGIEAMHAVYKNADIDYNSYAVPEGYGYGKLAEGRGGSVKGSPVESGTPREDRVPWRKWFDRIYCLHYLPDAQKLQPLKEELSRVGILDSGIFEFRFTSPSPFDKVIWKREGNPNAPKPLFVNICLEVRKCLAEALAFGYRRILFLENDVRFLKDLSELEKGFAATPAGFGVVQYDKFVNEEVVGDYKGRLADKMVNGSYFDGRGGFYSSAACIGLFGDGISEMLRVMDEHVCATDIAPQLMNCRYAVAAKNLAVQVFYAKSNSIDEYGPNFMHDVYRNAGVDYNSYAVPDGYGYGKVIGMEEKFKVSVYAIALNEERFIRRWYECFKEADEVCVLDTGSTDKTVEILRSLGAKVSVMHFDRWKTLEELDALTAAGKNPWRFDKARNEAMKLCSPDSTLLFCSDIDDVIEPGWRSRLESIWRKGVEEGKKLGHSPNAVLYTYAVVYNQGCDEQLQTFHRHSIHTPKGWHWEYRCHEVLESDGEPKNFIHAPEFHMESRPEKKDHSSYLSLLEADARDGSGDGRILHILAREYMQLGRDDEAIETFKKHLAYKRADWNCERAASMKFIGDCYARKGDEEQQELWLWRAMMEDPRDRDASYTLGRILVKRKDYKLAQKVLRYCLNIEKPTGEFPFFSLESWTERPYLSLVEAYFYDGKWASALETATLALLKFPKSAMAAKSVEEIKGFIVKGDAKQIREIQRFRIEIDK